MFKASTPRSRQFFDFINNFIATKYNLHKNKNHLNSYISNNDGTEKQLSSFAQNVSHANLSPNLLSKNFVSIYNTFFDTNIIL